MLNLGACAVFRHQSLIKIALLAPFEGTHRDIGYNALYAARLALADFGSEHFFLLAIDDGGNAQTALERAQAIAKDEAIQAVIVLGEFSSSAEVQRALGTVPTLIIGHWGASISREGVLMLAHPNLADFYHTPRQNNLRADLADELAIAVITHSLGSDHANFKIASSGAVPSTEFRERYLASGEFTPEPNLLAMLTYDAMAMSIESIKSGTPIKALNYAGLSGEFRFDNGYWLDAPLHYYDYDSEAKTYFLSD